MLWRRDPVLGVRLVVCDLLRRVALRDAEKSELTWKGDVKKKKCQEKEKSRERGVKSRRFSEQEMSRGRDVKGKRCLKKEMSRERKLEGKRCQKEKLTWEGDGRRRRCQEATSSMHRGSCTHLIGTFCFLPCKSSIFARGLPRYYMYSKCLQ